MENKIKHLHVENEFKKLKTFYWSYFRGKSRFEEDGTPNYLVLQPISRHFKLITNTKYILSWKAKGLYEKTIKPLATSDNSLSPLIDYLDKKIKFKFNRGCLKQQNKLAYHHSTIVNIYIAYEHGASGSFSNNPRLRNSLFGAVK